MFAKLGCREQNNKLNSLKMVTAVGLIMGMDALLSIMRGTEISLDIILRYLPVSVMYMSSMFLGYVAMRYIELSVSSPVCNCSGALVALVSIFWCIMRGIPLELHPLQYGAVALCGLGVLLLGIFEAGEDEELRAERQKKSNYRYAKSWLALAIPIAYCIIDAGGTFADSLILETMDEDSANVAYELTFFACGIICFVIAAVKARREQRNIYDKSDLWKLCGGLCETFGQLAYVHALADESHVTLTAPIIASYCAGSVVLGRLILKERLSKKHYLALAVTILGIIIMGVFDG